MGKQNDPTSSIQQMNIRRNSLWNVAEVALTALVQFLILRLIIQGASISALGVWSLVFSALSLARIADVGVAASLVRYIARPAEETPIKLSALHYIETAILTTVALYLVLGILIYAPTHYALSWSLKGDLLVKARGLLPYAIASFVLTNVANVVLSALIGLKRSDIKSILVICTLALQLAISWFSIAPFGLVGLACAVIVQNVFILTFGWILLFQLMPGERLRLPCQFHTLAFREMFGFGARLQLLTIVNFLYDPFTKFVFSAVMGPSALGLYEAAYRLVIQARAIVAAPAQNLTPMFAAISSGDTAAQFHLYRTATVLMVLASALDSLALVAISPIVSLLLLKQIKLLYIALVTILCLGWSINISSIPSYLMGVGRGYLKWNTIGSASATLLSVLLAYILGSLYGIVGAVIAASAATAIGSIITMMGNRYAMGLGASLPTRHDFHDALTKLKNDLSAMLIRR